MLHFSELALHSVINLGKFRTTATRESAVPMQWIKVSHNGLLIARRNIAKTFELTLDAPRVATGTTDRARRDGNTFLPDTYLFQFLNGTGTDWCHVPEGDVSPLYKQHFAGELIGFLDWFSPDERAALMSWDMRIAMPARLRKRHGDIATVPCTVGLPAAGEFDTSMYNDKWENSRFLERITDTDYNLRNPFYPVVTRSIIGESNLSIGANGQATAKSPSTPSLCHPMIRINPELYFTEICDRIEYVFEPELPETERDSWFDAMNNLWDM